MAHLSKLRKALSDAVLALVLGLLVAAWWVSPAASLGLPDLSGEVPVVTVKTPAVTITTPSVPVKTPSATAPTLTVSSKTPAAPTKTAPTKTSSTKAPAVKNSVPSVSAEGPTVSVAPSPTPSLGKSAVPAVGVTTTNPTPNAGIAAEAAPSTTDATTTNGASSAPNGQATPLVGAAGYGAGPGVQTPAAEADIPQSPGAREHMADDRSLVATVARLRGCLNELPEAHRRALMLRAGVGSSQALSVRATAARLHLAAARFAQVEQQALGELRKAARTRACGQMGELVAAVVSFIGSSVDGGGSAGRGGVDAARYAFPTPSRHAIKPAESSSRSLLGNTPPMARSAIAVLLLLVAAAIAAGIVVTHGSGNSPSWRRWRRRLANGLRRPR
jgi:hypothetical protein